MIPIRLELEGFLSYQSPAVIDFEEIQLACISGLNGAGKSSILDAITWSLFGQARSRGDDVINQNCKRAVVKLTFGYEGQTYRVFRDKEWDKALNLDLAIYDKTEDRWRVLTEHSSSETQRKLGEILRLDYKSFVNASFFLQGQADMFTNLGPGERKEILSNILGLDIWDTYKKSAAEQNKRLELERKRIGGILEEVESELAQEEQVHQQLKFFEEELKTKSEIKAGLETMLQQARKVEQARRNLETQIQALKNDYQRQSQRMAQKQEQSLGLQDQIGQKTAVIANQDQIRAAYARWQAVRAELEGLEAKREQFLLLERRKSESEHKIEIEKNRIETRLKGLEQESQMLEQQRGRLPELQAEIEQISRRIKEWEYRIQKRDEITRGMEEKQKEAIQKQAAIQQLKAENDKLREHLRELKGAKAECPMCGQMLTAEHREKYESKMSTEGVERKKLIDTMQTEIGVLEKEIQALKTQNAEILQLVKDLHDLEKSRVLKDSQVQNLALAFKAWEEEKGGEFDRLRQTLAAGIFLSEENENLAQTQNAIETLGLDLSLYQQCKAGEIELRAAEQELRTLEEALSAIKPLTEHLSSLTVEINEIKADLGEKENQIHVLKTEFEQHYSQIPDISQYQKRLDDLQIEITQTDRLIGGEKQKISSIERKKEEKRLHQEKMNELALLIARYAKLEEAFSKNGIPALLIEHALPQIQDHANALLERLTNGSMSITFETQSEYKDKKRLDKKETLDIKITDATGKTRSYEMFSGGEAFRINFAIRIALSKVLANRSGAKLQTLVIDEGFGSQDAEGIQRLLEVISQIKNDFAKILIITHLEELKDAFPARINVEKTSQGSQIQVQVY